MKHIKKIGATAAIAGAALSAGMISSNHNVKADTVSTTSQSQALHNDQQAAVKTSAQSKIAAAKSAVSSAQSRVDQTKPAADAAQDKINSAQSTVNADQSKVNQAQSAVDSANQQISQKKATIANDQSKVSSIKNEISNAQQNLPAAQKSAQAASQQVQQAQDKANAAKAAMDSAQSKVNDLTNQRNQTQDKINSLSQGTNLPAAQKAVSDAQNAVNNAQNKLNNDENTLSQAKQAAANNQAHDKYGHTLENVTATPEQEAEWDNGVSLNAIQQKMLDTVNLYRMAHGLAPLKASAALNQLADQRSQVAAQYGLNFDHQGYKENIQGKQYGDVDALQENYFSSPSSVDDVLGWLAEENNGFTHRFALLNPLATEIGFSSSTDTPGMAETGEAIEPSGNVSYDQAQQTMQKQTDAMNWCNDTSGIYTGIGAITPVPLSQDNTTPLTESQIDDMNSCMPSPEVTLPDPDAAQKLQDAQNAVNNDQANLTAAQNQLTNAQNQLNAAEESAAQKSAQIKDLQNTLNNINSELSNAQDVLNQAKNNYNSAESAAQTAQANADKLNNEVKQMQDALNNGQNEINQLENQIKQLENTPDPDVAALQNDLTNAQNALKDAQAALAQAKQDGAAPIAAYNQALNDLKNAEAQLNQAEQEAAAQKRAQEITAANQAHRDLDGNPLPAGAYIKPNGDIISATGKLIGKDGILFGTTAHFASDINNGTTLKSGTKVYFGNSNTVEAAEVPTKNVAKKTLPDTGDAQNTKAEEAGIVALGLAGIASAFGFVKRKKRN